MLRAYVVVVLLSLLSVATTLIGVLIASLVRENAKALALGIGFSTGIMLLISCLQLLPETLADLGQARTLSAVALGVAALWFADFAIPHSHLVREHGLTDTRLVKAAYLVVVGLVLHDVPEGFAMANAYMASPSLGLFVGLGIALHNLPEEFAMAVPALHVRSRRFLIGSALLSALAEPLGAIIGLLAVAARPSLNAHFIGFAAGAMIFVALHELLPMARRYGQRGWFASGLALSVVVDQALRTVTMG
jgi:ZIP family zinc transporter